MAQSKAGGCGPCKKTCQKQPLPPKFPSGFIFSLNEMNFGHKRITNLVGHTLIYDPKADPPRAALWISNNLLCWPIDTLTTPDMAVARVDCKDDEGKDISLFVCSLYCDSNYKPVIYPKMRQLMQLVQESKGQLLLLTDSNCHSPMWGEQETNTRGRKMEDFIAHHGLIVNNVGTNVTFFRYNAASIVDLVLSTPQLAKQIDHYQVVPFAPASDHIGITFTLKLSSGNLTKKRNYKTMDFPEYRNILEEACSKYIADLQVTNDPQMVEVDVNFRYMGVEDLENSAKALENDFDVAAAATTKLTSGKPKVAGAPWFNKKLDHLKAQLAYANNALAARKKCEKDGKKRNFNKEITHAHKKEKMSHYKKACRAKKRQYERQQTDDVTTNDKMNKFKKRLDYEAKIEMGLQEDDHGHLLDPEKSVAKVVNHFFVDSKPVYKTDSGPWSDPQLLADFAPDAKEALTKIMTIIIFRIIFQIFRPWTPQLPPVRNCLASRTQWSPA